MLNGGTHRIRDEIASALGWWAGAGVDVAIAEAPVNWLAPPPRAAARPAASGPALPADLAAFRALLATGDYLPGAPPPRRRVAPEGEAGARLMIVADMPDAADLAAGRLFAAEARLLDAMLAALRLDRAATYLAPLSPARLPGGHLGRDAAPLAALMRAHVALVRPAALLLFGEETCRTLTGSDRADACRALRPLNHDGGTVPAIATIHPRVLRHTPACKAEAWAAMRQLVGVLAP